MVIDWDPEDDLTLLELAEGAGINAPFTCRSGNCGTCAVPLLSGEVSYDPVPDYSVEPSRCLTCCARPASDVVVLEL